MKIRKKSRGAKADLLRIVPGLGDTTMTTGWRRRVVAIIVLVSCCVPVAARAKPPKKQAYAIKEFTIPTTNSNPRSLRNGADGNIWFTEQNANQIGRVNLDD